MTVWYEHKCTKCERIFYCNHVPHLNQPSPSCSIGTSCICQKCYNGFEKYDCVTTFEKPNPPKRFGKLIGDLPVQ